MQVGDYFHSDFRNLKETATIFGKDGKLKGSRVWEKRILVSDPTPTIQS